MLRKTQTHKTPKAAARHAAAASRRLRRNVSVSLERLAMLLSTSATAGVGRGAAADPTGWKSGTCESEASSSSISSDSATSFVVDMTGFQGNFHQAGRSVSPSRPTTARSRSHELTTKRFRLHARPQSVAPFLTDSFVVSISPRRNAGLRDSLDRRAAPCAIASGASPYPWRCPCRE